jgi:hypothetical protein
VTLVPAAVLGVGLWRPAPGAAAPPPRLPPRLRRRASLLVSMVAEVAAQAAEQAGASMATLPLVVGSAFGELATTMDLLRAIHGAGEGLVSPTQFQSSVHNTAAGYLSIAHGNRVASTSLAAGDETLGAVLLEALTLLTLRGGQVLAIVADEALPLDLVPRANAAAVSAAFLLAARPALGPADGRPLAVLEDLRAGGAAARSIESDVPCASAVRLVEAIRAGRSRRVELGVEGASTWSVAVRHVEGA